VGRLSPIKAITLGVTAAAVGTLAMDALWYVRYRRGGGESDPISWEIAAGLDNWENAPVPAKVGKRIAETLLRRELPPNRAQLMTNVMHWGYGLSWGALFGLVAGSMRKPSFLLGPVFGTVVFANDYVVLPLTGFYKPIWQYDLGTLWKDLSAHLLYGTMTALTFRDLAGE
jgi:hypothetical protein